MVWRHAEPNVYAIKPVNGKGLVHTVNWYQLQDLETTQEDKGSKVPYASHHRLQVPSYNPKVSQEKSPLQVSHPYATHSKGEPQTLSLSTTAGMGNGELNKTQTQSISFCSKCLGRPFLICDSNKEANTWVAHVVQILFAIFETWQHTSFSVKFTTLSPYLL